MEKNSESLMAFISDSNCQHLLAIFSSPQTQAHVRKVGGGLWKVTS